jgi:hypothetical protein
MPVTPGGTVANWDQRAKISGKPIWLFVGTKDNEYAKNSGLVSELEQSGATPFFEYTYAFADEYKDAVPDATLTSKHNFGSYTDIGHDVWHATFGVYCPTLKSYKTTQLEWLLAQSLDGSAFVDPRGTGGMGGAGGGAGSAGAAGSAGGGASMGGSAGMGGSGGDSTSAGSGGSVAVAGAAGSLVAAGSAGSIGLPNAPSDEGGGCSLSSARSGNRSLSDHAWGVLALLGWVGLRRRRG